MGSRSHGSSKLGKVNKMLVHNVSLFGPFKTYLSFFFLVIGTNITWRYNIQGVN